MRSPQDVSPLQLSLFIQWYSHGGKARVDQVRLKLVGKVDDLEVGFGSLHSAYA